MRERGTGSSDLHVEVLSAPAAVAAIEDDWSRLAAEVGAGPFGVPGIALPWWHHLGKGRLKIVVARRGGDVVAVLPLHERRIAGMRFLRSLGHGLGSITEIVGRSGPSGVGAELLEAVADRRGHVIEFPDVRADRVTVADVTAARFVVNDVEDHDFCPTIDLEGIADAGAHLARPGMRKLRQNLARVDRAMEAAGIDCRLDVLTSPSDVRRALDQVRDTVFAAEISRPRLNLLDDRHRLFTIDALDRAARRGNAAVFVLSHDDRPVGVHIALRSGPTAYAWYARFRPEAAEFSPGHVMLRGVVDWAARTPGLALLDLQLGADPYKRSWASGGYHTFGFTAARRGVLTVAERTIDLRGRAFVRAGQLERAVRDLAVRQPSTMPALTRSPTAD